MRPASITIISNLSLSFLHRTKKKKGIANHRVKELGSKKVFRRQADFNHRAPRYL